MDIEPGETFNLNITTDGNSFEVTATKFDQNGQVVETAQDSGQLERTSGFSYFRGGVYLNHDNETGADVDVLQMDVHDGLHEPEEFY
ncbi:MAG: polysaccharide lyase family 7 protein [Limnobacter sp.]|nr:polysaccharide lyase family 7 protein [Limnobacter sp.]